MCCSEKGLKVKKKCGGGKPNAPSCKSVCGIGGKPGGGGEGIFYSISIYSIFYSAKHRYIFIQAQLRAVVGFPRWKSTHIGWISNHWLKLHPVVGNPPTTWVEFQPLLSFVSVSYSVAGWATRLLKI